MRHVHTRGERSVGTDARAARPRPAQSGGGPAMGVLRLQRMTGNSAVARIVQGSVLARAPKSKAKPKKAPAPKPAAPAPAARPHKSSLSISEEKWDRATLIGHARDAENAKEWGHAAALYERAYELTPAKDVALRLYLVYKKLGDAKQAQHWLDISHGEQEAAPPVSYQQF
jgi:hypothetical protein